MPGMNGRQMADRLRRLRPSLRVLFMSGYPDDIIAHHGVIDMGAAYLEKPFTADSLGEKVREMLDRGGDASTTCSG
jgi:two-component system, cell cycle sensor histidine kinase and response regulator CckA